MFENDRMMRELHEIREKEYRVMKNLSFKEREKLRMKWIKNGLKKTGYKLVSLKSGSFKIIKAK